MGARQFDIHRIGGGRLVVIVQHDVHDAMKTRLVAPLLPIEALRLQIDRLNPVFTIQGVPYLLATQSLATLRVSELGERVHSIEDRRDDIIRAIDVIFTGI